MSTSTPTVATSSTHLHTESCSRGHPSLLQLLQRLHTESCSRGRPPLQFRRTPDSSAYCHQCFFNKTNRLCVLVQSSHVCRHKDWLVPVFSSNLPVISTSDTLPARLVAHDLVSHPSYSRLRLGDCRYFRATASLVSSFLSVFVLATQWCLLYRPTLCWLDKGVPIRGTYSTVFGLYTK